MKVTAQTSEVAGCVQWQVLHEARCPFSVSTVFLPSGLARSRCRLVDDHQLRKRSFAPVGCRITRDDVEHVSARQREVLYLDGGYTAC